jgi:maleate isomerase
VVGDAPGRRLGPRRPRHRRLALGALDRRPERRHPRPDLARGCRDFAAIAVDVAVLAHSSSSFIGGPGWDEAAVAALSAELPGTTTATTNGLDMREALAALGAKRPFLVMPACMSDGVIASAVAYLAAAGLGVPAAWRYRPLEKWTGIAPDGLYPAGMATDQDTGSLFDQVVRECPPDADSILLAGTGLRCVAVIEVLEKALGRPVVTANQASLWRALKAAASRPPSRATARFSVADRLRD